MNNGSIKRRKFLEAGLAGGAAIATLPIRKLFSLHAPIPDTYLKADNKHSKEYQERLLKIARKYGGEFGEVSFGMEARSD
jgi:hypothetical protein